MTKNKMAFDYSKLRGRIIEKFGSQLRFANDVGISRTNLSMKLNGKSYFTMNEIVRIKDALCIEPEYVFSYFFTIKG